MNRCSGYLIALTVSFLPCLILANEWESRELNGITVDLPIGSKKKQGKLRSMPDNTQWTTYEVQVPIEAARYHASICNSDQGQSLTDLANSFAKGEVRHQKGVFKRSGDRSLQSTKTFAKTSMFRTGEHRGWKTVEFTIQVEFELPSFGYGTKAIRTQCGQINVRLVESEKGIVALVREQYMGPFTKTYLAKRFFRSLARSDQGGQSK